MALPDFSMRQLLEAGCHFGHQAHRWNPKMNQFIFGVRNNEIFLFSQPRPVRSAHTEAGWTPDAIAERVFPMFARDFYPLERSGDVFTWDPV